MKDSKSCKKNGGNWNSKTKKCKYFFEDLDHRTKEQVLETLERVLSKKDADEDVRYNNMLRTRKGWVAWAEKRMEDK